jgi:hypothetical protein
MAAAIGTAASGVLRRRRLKSKLVNPPKTPRVTCAHEQDVAARTPLLALGRLEVLAEHVLSRLDPDMRQVHGHDHEREPIAGQSVGDVRRDT